MILFGPSKTECNKCTYPDAIQRKEECVILLKMWRYLRLSTPTADTDNLRLLGQQGHVRPCFQQMALNVPRMPFLGMMDGIVSRQTRSLFRTFRVHSRFSWDSERNIPQVRTTILLLKQAGAVLNIKMCKLSTDKMHYVGHEPHTGKRKWHRIRQNAIGELKPPNFVTELKSSLVYLTKLRYIFKLGTNYSSHNKNLKRLEPTKLWWSANGRHESSEQATGRTNITTRIGLTTSIRTSYIRYKVIVQTALMCSYQCVDRWKARVT